MLRRVHVLPRALRPSTRAAWIRLSCARARAQIAFADYVVCFELLLPWTGITPNSCFLAFTFLIVSLLAVGCARNLRCTDAVPRPPPARRPRRSHMRCMLTDPGAVPVEFQPSALLHEHEGSMPMCSRCNGFKPPRAHHCSQCDRCVMKMDHHCPWVNNCVGVNNQKHFVLFVGYTAVLSFYALVLLVFRMLAGVSRQTL